jgi:D-alanyl-D-alanine carboxypeptidase/D-alanyl-D-alanine-endopeptidase (penicillin-binding protein 4)
VRRSSRAGVCRPGAGAVLLSAILISLPVAGAAAGGLATSPASVTTGEKAARLAALLARLPAKAQVGLVVLDLSTGATVFAQDPETPLKPASVLKLFVTAAGLERFGPQFRYATRVYIRGDEVWVIGAGDPGLGDPRIAERYGQRPCEVFDEWATALKAAGPRRVSKLVLDDSVFEGTSRHPDWPASQADRWYQAPVGGLNINDNCLDARVDVRGNLNLVLTPDLPTDFVANSLRLGKKHQPVVRRRCSSDQFEFSGCVCRSDELGPVSAGQPTVFFGYALKTALARQGIAVADVVRRVIPDPGAAGGRLVAEHSTGLPDVLWRCNTFSQNLFAECLLKSLAAYGPDGRRTGQPGGWDSGVAVEQATLSKLGVDLSGAVLRDGSGLSHSNRVSAAQIVQLLAAMKRHRCANVFVDSLAAPGEDGSMRRRYARIGAADRLRAKTGTLAQVHSLAGYVDQADGTTLAFALLCNGPVSADMPVQVAEILAED